MFLRNNAADMNGLGFFQTKTIRDMYHETHGHSKRIASLGDSIYLIMCVRAAGSYRLG